MGQTSPPSSDRADAFIEQGLSDLRQRHTSPSVPMSPAVAAHTMSDAPSSTTWTTRIATGLALFGAKSMLGIGVAAAAGLGGAHAAGIVDLPVLPAVTEAQRPVVAPIEVSFATPAEVTPPIRETAPIELPDEAADIADDALAGAVALPDEAADNAVAALDDESRPTAAAGLAGQNGERGAPTDRAVAANDAAGDGAPGLGAEVSEAARAEDRPEGADFGASVADAARDREGRGLPEVPSNPDAAPGLANRPIDPPVAAGDDAAPGAADAGAPPAANGELPEASEAGLGRACDAIDETHEDDADVENPDDAEPFEPQDDDVDGDDCPLPPGRTEQGVPGAGAVARGDGVDAPGPGTPGRPDHAGQPSGD